MGIKCGNGTMMSSRGKKVLPRKMCRCRSFGANYWFLNYKWRENLSGDLVAGATMAIIQIPQGILKLNYILVN